MSLSGGKFANLKPGEFRSIPGKTKENYFTYADKDPDVEHVREGVHDDGSCFFHALACIRNENNYHTESHSNRQRIGHNLRRKLQSMITPQTWLPFWKAKGVPIDKVPTCKEIRRKMKDTNEWATVYMIRFCMDRLGQNLYFFDATNNKLYCGVENLQDTNPTGLVCWLNHAHFEPIVEINRHTGKVLKNFGHDHVLINNILRQYQKDGCARVDLKDVV